MSGSGTLLLRMGESGTKSAPVRRRWEALLRRNLEDIFLRAGRECVVRNDRGHLYVTTDDTDAATPLLQRTFGLTSFSPVIELRTDLEEIYAMTVEVARDLIRPAESFAIRARRTGVHPFTSQEVGRQAGSAVMVALADRGIRVDLTHPDREIEVEVRQERTYISAVRHPGPGGLPYGCEGKVVGIIRDWRWAVACWLVMKRGCRLIPLVEGKDGETALEVLQGWTGKTKFAIAERVDVPSLLSEAAVLAVRKRASAIVTGLNWSDIAKEPVKGELPVFYPLTGYSDEEIAALGRQIGFTGV